MGTWREDWPEQRAPEVTAIRRMVEASRDGGRAIVILARKATSASSSRALTLNRAGFAPHPLFARWVEEKIREGLERLPGAAVF